MYRLFLTFIILISFSHSLAQYQPGSRMLFHSHYQVVWDQNLNGATFYRLVGGVPTQISQVEFKSIVNSKIQSAFNSFAYYTDGIITSGTGDGIINVNFVNISPYWGQASLENQGSPSNLNINSTRRYTDDPGLLESNWGDCNTGNGYADLHTLIVHEMGHIFLGAGEYGACYSDSSVRAYCCDLVKRSLTQCDIDATRDAYNPKHTVTIKNSFGAGGDVKVDGVTYTNIPSTGKVFDQWRTTSFPHTLEAVDKQVPENGVRYWRRFNKWLKDDANYPGNRSISIPVSDGTFTAQMLKEYNIVFQNSFIGVGNGGIIKVNYVNYNSPKTSTVLETYSIGGASMG